MLAPSVLARGNRLTSGPLFAETIKKGQRAGTGSVVLHLWIRDGDGSDAGPAQIGFVVSKQVGNAVTRNQVKRRLRHLARERISSLPGSAVLVVRALPPSASSSYAELGAELDRALARLLGRWTSESIRSGGISS